ncbi:hypothetical protein [Sphingomonas sp.]|uniref:hypothetical protein n=1 Tax=Sphingomonas sp. TaxID=28214 RepID=UPI0035C7B217
MTRPVIYTVDADNRLTAMSPAAPENEDTMQRLIADYPEIIADADGALLLIRRELPIADSEEGAGRWSLDHLFVTRAGVPVLVELKRAVDTRLRREVVGQMLDYAANATAYWKAGTIAANFAASAQEAGQESDALLAEFLPEGVEADAFWAQVDANFSAGRVKLVFVADVIPRELARIVEFLNEQMRADVRAVELSWFEGHGVRAFTPRVIGETERAQAAKAQAKGELPPPMTRDEWIATFIAPFGDTVVQAAHRFTECVANAGGHAEVTDRQGSIVAVFEGPARTTFPLLFQRAGKGTVAITFKYLKAHDAFKDDAVRQQLYNRFAAIAGPLSTTSTIGFPSFSATRLNDVAVQNGITDLLRDMARKAAEA